MIVAKDEFMLPGLWEQILGFPFYFSFFCLLLFNSLNPKLDFIFIKVLTQRLRFTPLAFRIAHWCHNNLLNSSFHI